MSAHGSSFRRTELLLLLLLFPLFSAGCGPREVWGIPVEALKADLAAGRYASLAAIDFSVQDPAECLALPPGAPYYLSCIFGSLGKKPQAQALQELAWKRDASPWREEAGLQLIRSLISQKAYGRAIEAARGLLRSPVSPEVESRARWGLVQALYWNKDDSAVLEAAARLIAPDPEALLMRAVSSLRLGLPAAHDLVMQLFLSQRASPLHGRAYSFIAEEPGYIRLFSTAERDLLAGKDAFAQGTWAKGIPLLEKALAVLDPVMLEDGVLVVDLGAACLYAGRFDAGAASLERLGARLTGQARTDALEQAGRLYRRARDYPRALATLRGAAAEAMSAAQRDRARWLLLDVLFSQDPDAAARQAGPESAAWNDPAYFTDLLQERIAECVAARKWTTLAALWESLAAHGPAEVRAQLSYVMARAWQEGMIKRLPGDPPVTARDLFRDAVNRNPDGYYGILAASMLGELPNRSIPAAAPASSAAEIALDPVALGFLAFGLTDQAYDRLEQDTLDEAQLLDAARRFSDAGDHRSSLNLMGAVSRRRRLSLPEMRDCYPRAFAAYIEPLARDTGISLPVLYGMVREESYFDAGAVSYAGAIGLSQLMPATADDVARRLRIKDPDLRDPATNLAIGTHHFSDLAARTGSTPKALLAYNAGLNRLRQWVKASPGLPEDLLIETVPFAETREYVRKILISTVMYAFLYHEADPREAALSFFGISAH